MIGLKQDATTQHLLRILTIGVYGFTEASFFDALTNACVDTFCDIRYRRGLRGSQYAFANSQRLQARLERIGIRYIHNKSLAPAQTVRELQRRDDEDRGVGKRSRDVLALAFVKAYTETCLSEFDSRRFLASLGPDARVIALFCVERDPAACHRSIVAERVCNEMGLVPHHITP